MPTHRLLEFCQWSFFRQWLELKAYANGRGVKLVGDVPIFIGHHSAEVWAHQALFELGPDGMPTAVAGVPPDFFSATGQRWGNPLYRWDVHARDGFAWWVERMRRVFELVDIVRIDHFRGFAGYWEIPASEPTAVHGHWRPGPGAALFEAVAEALGPMPIIAEDLGVITPDVEALRRRFQFPGMRILQFAFSDDARNGFLPHHHERDTVVYPGTHDNDTSIGWWAGASEHDASRPRLPGSDGHGMAWTLIRAACAWWRHGHRRDADVVAAHAGAHELPGQAKAGNGACTGASAGLACAAPGAAVPALRPLAAGPMRGARGRLFDVALLSAPRRSVAPPSLGVRGQRAFLMSPISRGAGHAGPSVWRVGRYLTGSTSRLFHRRAITMTASYVGAYTCTSVLNLALNFSRNWSMPAFCSPSTPPASAHTTAVAIRAAAGSSPVQMPSPPMNLARCPAVIWRIIGPATASMPPKNTMSASST